MDNKKLGIILIIIAISLALIFGYFRVQLERSLRTQITNTEGGVCVHIGEKCPFELINEMLWPTIIGVALIVLILGLGIYFIFFEKSQKAILETLKETKETKLKEDKFETLLKGLDDNEKKVLKAVKGQDGISQTTLRLRTDLSKAKLSMILSDFEKKSLIRKVKKGKINNIFLKEAL